MSLMLRIAGGIVLSYLAISALGYIAVAPRWFAKFRCERAGGFYLVAESKCIPADGYVTVTVDKHGRLVEPNGRIIP